MDQFASLSKATTQRVIERLINISVCGREIDHDFRSVQEQFNHVFFVDSDLLEIRYDLFENAISTVAKAPAWDLLIRPKMTLCATNLK